MKVRPVTFFVPGEPTAKGRPRMARNGRVYTPEKTAHAESLAKMAASTAMGQNPPLEGPLSLQMVARFGVPGSWSGARKERALAGEEMPTKRPDVDNLIKLVADAMNGIVYGDDAQIVLMSAAKVYAPQAGTEITVETIKTKGDDDEN